MSTKREAESEPAGDESQNEGARSDTFDGHGDPPSRSVASHLVRLASSASLSARLRFAEEPAP